MKNFRTYQIAVAFYQLASAETLPKHLKDQLVRASSSIALNPAEGAARYGRKDQKKFFNIAFASLRECQAILDLHRIEKPEIRESADKLGAHIYKLIRTVS